LWFTPYAADSELVQNRFGIPEPRVLPRRRVPPWRLDLILVPLVGFDSAGNRLGMGGGFYDQTLAFLQRRSHWRKPRLLGIAYDFQQLDQLPAEPWDIPLDGIATESRIHLFRRA
jgi:5-formyltetrahydrofolate cyclo-ligase